VTGPDDTEVIDAHQHLWDPATGGYPWLTPDLGPIHRAYGPGDAEPHLRATGVDRCILVQAADSYADTDSMLAVADHWPRVAAVVGWVPLMRPAEAAEALDRYRADARFVGVRHLIHDDPDPDWLLRPEVSDGLRLLAERGLSFDVVAVLPRHLEHVPVLAEAHPDLRLFIDHLAKPPIAAGEWEPWAGLLAAAARFPNVAAKISGLDTAADPEKYRAADLRRYVDHAFDCFGSDRLLFGTDWPISELAGGYERWWEVVRELLEPLPAGERSAILGGNARRWYRVPTGTEGGR
jgi:L-fuconolactonase